MENKAIISIQNVSYSYEKKIVLDYINLDIPQGTFMGLLGPNGSGKTTLIKLILGLLKPDSGHISLFDKPIEQFKEWNKIGFVSQKANSFNRGFPATVFEVVSTGMTSKVGYLKFLTHSHRAKIKKAIDIVGMRDFMYENIGNLSGGQQQRVFIARSLVSEPELLILDEPTVGVDSANVKHFYELLYDLNQNHGITLLLVTHDTGTMTKFATDIVCLNKQLHFHGNPAEFAQLSGEELSKVYGHVNLVSHDH